MTATWLFRVPGRPAYRRISDKLAPRFGCSVWHVAKEGRMRRRRPIMRPAWRSASWSD